MLRLCARAWLDWAMQANVIIRVKNAMSCFINLRFVWFSFSNENKGCISFYSNKLKYL